MLANASPFRLLDFLRLWRFLGPLLLAFLRLLLLFLLFIGFITEGLVLRDTAIVVSLFGVA